MPFSKLYSISYDAFKFESPDGTENKFNSLLLCSHVETTIYLIYLILEVTLCPK